MKINEDKKAIKKQITLTLVFTDYETASNTNINHYHGLKATREKCAHDLQNQVKIYNLITTAAVYLSLSTVSSSIKFINVCSFLMGK